MCGEDDLLFLETYFPNIFRNEWTDDRKEMVEAINFAITYGSDRAIAGLRGEGKSAITKGMTIKAVAYGKVKFPLVVTKSGPMSQQMLRDIKKQLARNPILAADFPEMCIPAFDVSRAPNRAAGQTVNGVPTDIFWTADEIHLPTIYQDDGTPYPCSGAIIVAKGLDGAIRGINVDSIRPDLVIIDDAETEDSARSDLQIETRENVIEQDIGGLAEGGKPIARVMLCTIQNRKCLAFKYTDPHNKPWNGKRFAFMKTFPVRRDMWDKYEELCHTDKRDGDTLFRTAHAYYVENREEMDRGAEVSRVSRFNPGLCPDGTPREISAVQAFFNEKVRKGEMYVLCELQQQPPEEEIGQQLKLDQWEVKRNTRPLMRGVAPNGTTIISFMCDLGDRLLHWAAVAALPDGGHVVDYGRYVTGVIDKRTEKAFEHLLFEAMTAVGRSCIDPGYVTEGGAKLPVKVALWDSGDGDHKATVYRFVAGKEAFIASKGYGDGRYKKKAQGTATQDGGSVILARDYIDVSLRPGKIRHSNFDADHWKHYVHSRFATKPGTPGAWTLFATEANGEPADHQWFAEHLTAEEYRQDYVQGKHGNHIKSYWKNIRSQNHMFDVMVGCACGHDLYGKAFIGEPVAPTIKPHPPMPGMKTPDGREFFANRRVG